MNEINNQSYYPNENSPLRGIVKKFAILIAGPIGSYSIYNYYFIKRYINQYDYPYIFNFYNGVYKFIDIIIISFALIFIILYMRLKETVRVPLKTSGILNLYYICFTIITVLLIALSVYRVFGSLDITNLIMNYSRYYAISRDGGAWIFLAAYMMLYVMLIDMYFNGVYPYKIGWFTLCIAVNSINGGRSLLILMMVVAYLLWLMQTRRPSRLVIAGGLLALLLAIGFWVITDLRGGGDEEARRLNFNSAFILEDVLYEYEARGVDERFTFWEDVRWLFVPRSLNPDKPRSTAETRLIYPEIAARGTGTNVTFPLEANILLNLGREFRFVDWIVVFLFHLLLVWSIVKRSSSPTFVGFLFFFWGCAFILIARGGIFNARLIVQSLTIFMAYLMFRAMMRLPRLNI